MDKSKIPNKYNDLESKMPIEKLMLFEPNKYIGIDDNCIEHYEAQYEFLVNNILDYMNEMFMNLKHDLKKPQLGWGEVKSQFNSYIFREAQSVIAFRVYHRLAPEMKLYSKIVHKKSDNILYERIINFHRLFMLAFITKNIIDANGKRLKSFNKYLLAPEDKYKVKLGKIIKLASNDVSEFIASYEITNEQPNKSKNKNKRKSVTGWSNFKQHEEKRRKLNPMIQKELKNKKIIKNNNLMDLDNPIEMEKELNNYRNKYNKLAMKKMRESIQNENSNHSNSNNKNEINSNDDDESDVKMYHKLQTQVDLLVKGIKLRDSSNIAQAKNTNKQLTNMLYRQKELVSHIADLQSKNDILSQELYKKNEMQKIPNHPATLPPNNSEILKNNSNENPNYFPTPFPTPTKHTTKYPSPIPTPTKTSRALNDHKRGAENYSNEYLVQKSLNGFEVIDKELYKQSIKGNDGNGLYAKLMNKGRQSNKDVVAELQGKCRVCTLIPIGVRVQYALSQPSGLTLR